MKRLLCMGLLALYATSASGAPAPLEPPPFLAGMFVYMADAARLTECKTDRSFPVAMEGDYRRLEQAYLEAQPGPGQPLMVTIDGGIEERPRIDAPGTEPTVIVARFINTWPGETCERNRADASLTNTYWRIVRLGDEVVHAADGGREPHIQLRAGKSQFSATVGCNQVAGGYELIGGTLRFQSPASTMMACPPPLDRLERLLVDSLANTKTWRITAQFLELSDADGKPVALLQAVYLR